MEMPYARPNKPILAYTQLVLFVVKLEISITVSGVHTISTTFVTTVISLVLWGFPCCFS